MTRADHIPDARMDLGELLEDWAEAQTSVGLEQLNEQASLLTRVDRKYVLTTAQAVTLLRDLERRSDRTAEALAVLSTGPDAFARYESLYFDTPALVSYYQAAHKRRRRFKVRTRSYLDTGVKFLEVKTAGGRGLTHKERIEIPFASDHDLAAHNLSFVQARLSDAHLNPDLAAGLTPQITTTYRRLTILQPDGESRATIDLGLTWRDDANTVRPHGLVIVETKSGSAPSPLDRLLWQGGLRPATFSKFAVGMAVIRPELSANKWNRALRNLREGQNR